MSLKVILLLVALGILWGAPQQNYNDFEGNKYMHFGWHPGTLDSVAKNPWVRGINKSAHCAKYQRNRSEQYDNIKIYPAKKLSDVKKYATYKGFPPKLKMKIFTTAPEGTIVELQFGSKADDNYPSGCHSQYQAVITKRNAWEELTFNFLMTPKGSTVPSTEIDKITLLFGPNVKTNYLFYFDDLTGPVFYDNELLGAK